MAKITQIAATSGPDVRHDQEVLGNAQVECRCRMACRSV